MTTSRRVLPLCLFAALCGAASARAQGRESETFRDELRVREVSVIAPLSTRLARAIPETIRPNDFLATVDGIPCPVLRVEKMPKSEWQVIVYVDPSFGSPESQVASLLALARRAEDLTTLGPVEVVIVDPRPTPLGPPTQDPQALLTHLADAAQAAQTVPKRESPLARQVDRLARFAADHQSRSNGLLFLVGDGTLESYSKTEATFAEAATVLAAYGWLAVPIAITRLDETESGDGTSDYQRYRSQFPQISGIKILELLRWIKTRRTPRKPIPPSIETQILAELAPMRRLANATGGLVLGTEPQLAPAFAALNERWRLWLAVPVRDDGRLTPLEVADSTDGERLNTRSFLRSSAPEGLSAARARALLDDLELKGLFEVTAKRITREVDHQTHASVAIQLGQNAASGRVRITLAFAREGTATVLRHVEAEASKAFEIQAPEAADAERVAVVVQPLSAENETTWGGVVVRP